MLDRNAVGDLLFSQKIISKFLEHFRQAFVKL